MDSAMDLIYFTSFDTGVEVACCTTVFDLTVGKQAAFTTSLIGKGYERVISQLYVISNILLIAFLAYYAIRVTGGKLLLLKTAAAGTLLAVINAVITVVALFEVISPKAMDLPYHHCVYCMWQYAPTSIMMTALFVLGTFSPGWALVLAVAGRHQADTTTLLGYQRRLALMGMGCLGISLCMGMYYLLLK